MIHGLAILFPALIAAGFQPGFEHDRWRNNALKPAGGGDTDTLSRGLANDTSSVDAGEGFGKVYELPRRRGDPRRFARFNGAVTAVFPMSTYASTPSGEIPTIPPGTTYYLGSDWFRKLTLGASEWNGSGLLDTHTHVSQFVSGEVTNAVDVRAHGQATRLDAETHTPRSIWTDESFRAQRLERLLGR